MEITSRPISTSASGTTTTSERGPSGITTTKTTPSTATCGRITIWTLCTALVEQSSRTDCHLRDEALKKKKKEVIFITTFFFLPTSLRILFFPHIHLSVDDKQILTQLFSPPLSTFVEWLVMLVNLVYDLRLSTKIHSGCV